MHQISNDRLLALIAKGDLDAARERCRREMRENPFLRMSLRDCVFHVKGRNYTRRFWSHELLDPALEVFLKDRLAGLVGVGITPLAYSAIERLFYESERQWYATLQLNMSSGDLDLTWAPTIYLTPGLIEQVYPEHDPHRDQIWAPTNEDL